MDAAKQYKREQIVKAFILAAGEGRRMRPLTLKTPKPLMRVGDLSLIEHQVMRLKRAGITEIAINLCYLGEQIVDVLGDGKQYGVNVVYSSEPQMLETGGAINHASDWLGQKPFLMVNSDIWLEIDYADFVEGAREGSLKLLLVPNPSHNEKGDFFLNQHHQVLTSSDQAHSIERLTFAGVSVICPKLFFEYPKLRAKFPLVEVFNWAIGENRVTGQRHGDTWVDVGTPERLDYVRRLVANGNSGE